MGIRLLQLHSLTTALAVLLALSLDSALAFTGMTSGNKYILIQEKLKMMNSDMKSGLSGNDAFPSRYSSKDQKITGVAGRKLFLSPLYDGKGDNKNIVSRSLHMKKLWLKQKIQSSKAFMTKFMAFSLMFWSLRPNQAIALNKTGHDVTPKKDQVFPKIIVGGIAGVGTTLIVKTIKNRKEDDDNASKEENESKFKAIISDGEKVEKSSNTGVPAPVSKAEEQSKKSIEDEKIRKILLKQKQEAEEKKAAKAAAQIAEEEKARAMAKAAEEEAEAKKAAAAAAAAAEKEAKRIAEEEEKIKAANEAAAAAKYAEEVEARRQKAKEEEAIRAQKLKETRAKQLELEAQKALEAEMKAPSVQPKPQELEQNLSDKYNSIEDLEERAFTILVDLNMVFETPDPDDPNYDDSLDNDIARENKFLK